MFIHFQSLPVMVTGAALRVLRVAMCAIDAVPDRFTAPEIGQELSVHIMAGGGFFGFAVQVAGGTGTSTRDGTSKSE